MTKSYLKKCNHENETPNKQINIYKSITYSEWRAPFYNLHCILFLKPTWNSWIFWVIYITSHYKSVRNDHIHFQLLLILIFHIWRFFSTLFLIVFLYWMEALKAQFTHFTLMTALTELEKNWRCKHNVTGAKQHKIWLILSRSYTIFLRQYGRWRDVFRISRSTTDEHKKLLNTLQLIKNHLNFFLGVHNLYIWPFYTFWRAYTQNHCHSSFHKKKL